MPQPTTFQDTVRFLAGNIRFTLSAPVSGAAFDGLLATVYGYMGKLIPALSRLGHNPGGDSWTLWQETFRTSRGDEVTLRVRVQLDRLVDTSELNKALKHSLSETHELVAMLQSPAQKDDKHWGMIGIMSAHPLGRRMQNIADMLGELGMNPMQASSAYENMRIAKPVPLNTYLNRRS